MSRSYTAGDRNNILGSNLLRAYRKVEIAACELE